MNNLSSIKCRIHRLIITLVINVFLSALGQNDPEPVPEKSGK